MTVAPAHVDPALVRAFDYHSDPAFVVDPFAGFDAARGDRVFFSVANGGYWVLTRAEDIRNAFQKPDLFSSTEFTIPSSIFPRTLAPPLAIKSARRSLQFKPEEEVVNHGWETMNTDMNR